MKHTPGPWHWVNPNTDEPHKRGESYADLRTVADYGTAPPLPMWIVSCEELGFGGEDEVEANLSLIAAAPDLLAALERLASYGNSFSYRAGESNPYQQALEAIAKAKGEGKV